MKKLFIVLIMFSFVISNYAFAADNAKKSVAKSQSKQTDERPWLFDTSTNNWSFKNIAYGPVEIIAGVFTPVLGTMAGFGMGIVIPHKFMKKGSEFLFPITIPCGMAAGATFGLAFTPICAIEGVFDTVTFGAFSDGYFSWVDMEELKDVSASSVEKEIIIQPETEK